MTDQAEDASSLADQEITPAPGATRQERADPEAADGLRADRELDRRIGEVLRAQRLARRMSMEAVGRATGVTYQQIQKYEIGSNRIAASTLYRLARILRCSVGIFFEGIGHKPHGALTRPTRENTETARALDRIEDPLVRDALCELITAIARGTKDG